MDFYVNYSWCWGGNQAICDLHVWVTTILFKIYHVYAAL